MREEKRGHTKKGILRDLHIKLWEKLNKYSVSVYADVKVNICRRMLYFCIHKKMHIDKYKLFFHHKNASLTCCSLNAM